MAQLAFPSIAPAKGGAVSSEGEVVQTSSRHSDDALTCKGLNLLRQQLALRVAVAQRAKTASAIPRNYVTKECLDAPPYWQQDWRRGLQGAGRRPRQGGGSAAAREALSLQRRDWRRGLQGAGRRPRQGGGSAAAREAPALGQQDWRRGLQGAGRRSQGGGRPEPEGARRPHRHTPLTLPFLITLALARRRSRWETSSLSWWPCARSAASSCAEPLARR